MESKHKISIAIGYYLPQDNYIANSSCIPIQLGFDETKVEMGIQKDNEGDNRSNKHPIYSEYSGIYWLWRNVDAEYKGFLHHRRFFTYECISISQRIQTLSSLFLTFFKNLFFHRPYQYCYRVECNSNEEYVNKVDDFISSLPHTFEEGYDIVTTSPYHYVRKYVKDSFSEVVTRPIQKLLNQALKDLYPEYVRFFNETFWGHSLYYGNMSIMKSELYDVYCQFIFDIFDYIETKLLAEQYYIDLSREKAIYRSFGYIGELLTSAFILKARTENKKVKELNVLFNKTAPGGVK